MDLDETPANAEPIVLNTTVAETWKETTLRTTTISVQARTVEQAKDLYLFIKHQTKRDENGD